ncbi:MAG: hypothetical protein KDA28_00485, partial [Phycisphaerales bacterium]|nr:hypothetical protein [Phycisphaerales bacterium]
MDSLVATLVLILVALVGARLSFSTDLAPSGPRLLFRTGTHFIAVGYLLGPDVLGLLSAQASRQLSPILAVGLGWVGFHFGLQLDRATLLRFAARSYVVMLG